MSIKNNTINLQSLLEQVNNLPEAGGGINTSDATATADKIFLNETAYVNDKKVVGTFTIDEELDEQDDLLAQLESALEGKIGGGGGGSIQLPSLSSPASASEVFKGKQAIDKSGNLLTGTYSIDAELNTQQTLLTELENLLSTKI